MGQDTNEVEIRALVESWAKAVRAQDMEGAIAHHSADIVMFDVPEPLQSIGIDEYRKTWELFFAHSPGGPGSFDVAELKITSGDNVAWCHAFLKVRDSIARLTMGLRKEDGQWLVAHEHHSYPLKLTSDQ
jgi:ketosteroid isomerase-like protein